MWQGQVGMLAQQLAQSRSCRHYQAVLRIIRSHATKLVAVFGSAALTMTGAAIVGAGLQRRVRREQLEVMQQDQQTMAGLASKPAETPPVKQGRTRIKQVAGSGDKSTGSSTGQ